MDVNMHQRLLATALLDALDQIVGGLRLQQSRHVLDADRIAAYFDQLLRHFGKGFDRMYRADGVTDGALRVLARLLDSPNGGAQVAQVVERVEDAEHIHAVVGGLVDKTLDHAVFIVAIAKQILTAKQHVKARLGQQLAEGAETFPGIFVEEPNAGIEGRSTPALQRPEAGIIEVFAGRNHVFHRHSGRQQTLVSIPQDQFGDFNRASHTASSFSVGFATGGTAPSRSLLTSTYASKLRFQKRLGK